MSDLLTNRLNMIGATLGVADSPEHQLVWQDQPPVDFGTDLALLRTGYTAALDLAQRAGSAITGTAQAKDLAETTLENLAYPITRALVTHLRKTGDAQNFAKVSIRKSQLQRLRDQHLLTRTREIRDLAQAALSHIDAAKRGLTAARVTALTAAIDTFAPLVNAARTEIANRSALLRELETDVAALVEDATELDDLILQFESEAGETFQTAWFAARQIIDAGHGSSGEDEPPTGPPNTPTT
jgi:chromosome segregation ATPase